MRLRVLASQVVRKHDNFGDGHFGASRDDGQRQHKGVDLVAAPNTPVLAPFTGKVTHKGVVYEDDRYQSLHIVNEAGDLRVVMFYIDSRLEIHDEIFKGQLIGKVEDISAKYKGITNHLHVEVYKNGNIQNPTKYLTQQIIKKPNQIKFNDKPKTQDGDLSSIVYSGEDGILVEDLLEIEEFSSISVESGVFLATKYKGKSNSRRIYDQLDATQLEEAGDFEESQDYPINNGTELYIKRSTVRIVSEYDSNITVSKLNDPKYLPEEISRLKNSSEFKTSEFTLTNPKVTVFAWSRNIYQRGKDGFVNITPYVIRCSTNTTMQSGDFSLEVSEITFGEDYDDINETLNSITTDGFKSQFYFEKILQQNDLIFIKFEQLEIEGQGEQVVGQWYDMIGMIDAVSEQTSIEGQATASITIRGRDLSKALADDNSYFNPYSIGHSSSIYGGSFGDRMLDGSFTDISAFLARTIEENVKFIAERISSIEYVPSEIFDGWEDRTIFNRSQANTVTNEELISFRNNGIWSIIKFYVDENLKNLRLVDDSVSNPEGSVWELLGKTAQNPFVEYYGETYGDQYYVIFREPPYTKKALEKALLENDAIEIEDAISDSLSTSNESYAWYRVHDRGNFAGNSVTLGTSPSLYLPEYANVFGNKMLEVHSNYSNYKFFNYEGKERDLDVYAEQQSQHLAFLVETTAYLPFTRQGQIIIEGDRRIKKGEWIYYKLTNEVFYVNGVVNLYNKNMTVERRTILQVERGMIRNHVFDDKNSYFNIVDIKKLREGVYDTIAKGSVSDKFDQKSPIAINTDVFDFFIQKRQFE